MISPKNKATKPIEFTENSLEQLATDMLKDESLKLKADRSAQVYGRYLYDYEYYLENAYYQLAEVNSLTAEKMGLSTTYTKDFEAVRDAYLHFCKVSHESSEEKQQALNNVLLAFESHKSNQQAYASYHPPFNDTINYFGVAKVVFDSRLKDLLGHLATKPKQILGAVLGLGTSSQKQLVANFNTVEADLDASLDEELDENLDFSFSPSELLKLLKAGKTKD